MERAPNAPLRARATVSGGLAIIIMLFGFFGAWSITANIDAAVIAQGELIMEGNRVRVQHLEGGIVASIEVGDGERVHQGDPLIRISDVRARAQAMALRAEYFDTLGRMARLSAERSGHSSIRFSERMTEAAVDPQVRSVITMQETLFRSRRHAFEGQREILAARVPQYQSMIRGLDAQLEALETQQKVLDEELRIVEGLVRRGLERRPRYLQLLRSAAAITGEIGEIIEKRSQTQLAITEVEMRLIDMADSRLAAIDEELTPLLSRLIDLEDRLAAAEDQWERTVIRAPVSGVVVGLSIHTIGAIVQPGAFLLSIVPATAELIVHARISPTDVDLVSPGLTAKVVLSAFKQNDVPPIEGRVRRVSADRLQDERTGETFFEAVIEIDEYIEKRNEENLRVIMPGMSAEVFIRTGSRTPLQYMVQPLRDSFRRALRES